MSTHHGCVASTYLTRADDEEQPDCQRCRKAGQPCIKGWNVKFVHGVRMTREPVQGDWDGNTDYLFDDNQPWIPIQMTPSITRTDQAGHVLTPGPVSFVDETEETRSWHTDNGASAPVIVPLSPQQNIFPSLPLHVRSATSTSAPPGRDVTLSNRAFHDASRSRETAYSDAGPCIRSPSDPSSGSKALQ